MCGLLCSGLFNTLLRTSTHPRCSTLLTGKAVLVCFLKTDTVMPSWSAKLWHVAYLISLHAIHLEGFYVVFQLNVALHSAFSGWECKALGRSHCIIGIQFLNFKASSFPRRSMQTSLKCSFVLCTLTESQCYSFPASALSLLNLSWWHCKLGLGSSELLNTDFSVQVYCVLFYRGAVVWGLFFEESKSIARTARSLSVFPKACFWLGCLHRLIDQDACID